MRGCLVLAIFFSIGGCAMPVSRAPARAPALPLPPPERSAPSVVATRSAAAPAEADARFKAALALMKGGETQAATDAFESLAHDYPTLSGALTDLGILFAQGQHKDQALASLDNATRINGDNAVALNWLGILYRERGDLERSEQCYLRAIKASPSYAAAYLNVGILYEVALHRPKDAISYYRQYQERMKDPNLIVGIWIKELEASTAAMTASIGDSH